jgi:hypothetical protein
MELISPSSLGVQTFSSLHSAAAEPNDGPVALRNENCTRTERCRVGQDAAPNFRSAIHGKACEHLNRNNADICFSLRLHVHGSNRCRVRYPSDTDRSADVPRHLFLPCLHHTNRVGCECATSARGEWFVRPLRDVLDPRLCAGIDCPQTCWWPMDLSGDPSPILHLDDKAISTHTGKVVAHT